MDQKTSELFDIIALDITSFCNLRCPFCLSDHSVSKTLMDEELFEKAITLIPLVSGNNFLFSCLYEPTLHPKFLTYLKKIPEELRGKVFFTTNLTKKLDSETIEELAQSKIHHINISLDSLEQTTFEIFRKGAKFSVFESNLEKLAEIFSSYDKAPLLFYTSVVNRLNYKEIPKLVETCATRYQAKLHDIREYWLLSHQNEIDWCIENKLTETEVCELRASLQSLEYNHVFSEAGRDVGQPHPDAVKGSHDIVDEKIRRSHLCHLPTDKRGIRIHADGVVEVLGRNIRFHLDDINNPPSFFSNLTSYIDLDRAKTIALRKTSSLLLQKTLKIEADPGIQHSVDEVLFDPKTLTIRGWCFHKTEKDITIQFTFPDQTQTQIDYTPQPSPDVAAIHGQKAEQCRFSFPVFLNYNYTIEELHDMKILFRMSNSKPDCSQKYCLPALNVKTFIKKFCKSS